MENSMVSAMERIEFENGKLADGIKSVARSVLVEWQRVFIFQRTAQAATGFLSTIATNIAGAFAAPAVTPNAPGNMALQPNRLQGFAGGGVSDRPAIFGDGPGSEAAVPLPDGRSIPVKLEGGGVPNVTVINNGTPQQVTDTQSIMENGQAFLRIWTEDFVNEGQGTFGVIQNSKGL